MAENESMAQSTEMCTPSAHLGQNGTEGPSPRFGHFGSKTAVTDPLDAQRGHRHSKPPGTTSGTTLLTFLQSKVGRKTSI